MDNAIIPMMMKAAMPASMMMVVGDMARGPKITQIWLVNWLTD